MRNLRLVVAVAVALCLVGLLGYIAYRLVLPVWAPVFFFSYLAAGLVAVVGSWAFFRRVVLGSLNPREKLKRSAVEAARATARSRLGTVQRVASAVAQYIQVITLWPGALVLAISQWEKRRGLRPPQARVQGRLQNHESTDALVALSILMICAVLERCGLDAHGYGYVFATLIGIGVLARECRYLIEEDGLPTRLRRVSTRPYFAFVVIVVADVASLVLALTILASRGAAAGITFTHLGESAADLFKFKQLLALLSGRPLPQAEILSGFVGLLFYTAYCRTLLRFREFRQTDDDRHWLAGAHSLLGQFAIALRVLGSVRSPTAATHHGRVVAFLGLNELAQAEREAALYLADSGETITGVRLLRVLIDCAVLAPIPPDSLLSLFKKSVQEEVPDFVLADAVHTFLIMCPSLLKQIRTVTDGAKTSRPLAFGSLAMLDGRFEEARETLDRATPGSEVEEVTREMLRLLAKLEDPTTSKDDAAIAFSEWAAERLPAVAVLVAEVTDPFELFALLGLFVKVRKFASIVAPELGDRITYHAEQIKVRVAGHPVYGPASSAIEHRIMKPSR